MDEDVVKRLRRERGPVYGPLCQEAAAEIERLRALLRQWVEISPGLGGPGLWRGLRGG
jgi:hypothetical protein